MSADNNSPTDDGKSVIEKIINGPGEPKRSDEDEVLNESSIARPESRAANHNENVHMGGQSYEKGGFAVLEDGGDGLTRNNSFAGRDAERGQRVQETGTVETTAGVSTGLGTAGAVGRQDDGGTDTRPRSDARSDARSDDQGETVPQTQGGGFASSESAEVTQDPDSAATRVESVPGSGRAERVAPRQTLDGTETTSAETTSSEPDDKASASTAGDDGGETTSATDDDTTDEDTTNDGATDDGGTDTPPADPDVTFTLDNSGTSTPDYAGDDVVTVTEPKSDQDVDTPWGSVNADTQLKASDGDGASIHVEDWNSVKSVRAEGEAGADVTVDNFVRADVDLSEGTGDSTVTINDAKRGSVETAGGDDVVDINAETNGSGWDNTFTVDTGAGDDTITATGDGGHTHFDIKTGEGADSVTLDGQSESATIVTEDAATINVSGADTVDITTGESFQTRETSSGYEYKVYGDNSVTVDDAEATSVHTGRGDDSITVGASGEGEDTVFVDSGHGNDTITVTGEGGETHVTVDGGYGRDTVTLDGDYGSSEVHLDGGTAWTKADGTAVRRDNLTESQTTRAHDDTFEGGVGDDLVTGGGGEDVLDGAAGDDRLFGDSGDDTLIGGSGNDTLTGGSGDDRLIGGSGDDTLSGDSGDDVLAGGSGNDALSGGAGDDTLSGGSGDDTLSGGEGTDTAIFSGPVEDYDITVNDDDTITVIDKVEGRDGTDTLDGIENVQFSDGTLDQDGLTDLLAAREAAEQLAGTSVTIDTSNYDSTEQGFAVKAINIDADGNRTEALADNVSRTGSGLGANGNNASGPAGQIGYDADSGQGEALVIELDAPASSATATFTRAFANERGGEQVSWEVYKDGEKVGEGNKTADSGHSGEVTIESDGVVFDEIRFVGDEYADGTVSGNGDASDFMVQSVEVNFADAEDLAPAAASGGDTDSGSGDIMRGTDFQRRGMAQREETVSETGSHARDDENQGGGGDTVIRPRGRVQQDQDQQGQAQADEGSATGTDGDDVLTGGAGNDRLDGGKGDDVVDGGAGSDQVDGGQGDDTGVVVLKDREEGGTASYDGGDGVDTLRVVVDKDSMGDTDKMNALWDLDQAIANGDGDGTFDALGLEVNDWESMEMVNSDGVALDWVEGSDMPALAENHEIASLDDLHSPATPKEDPADAFGQAGESTNESGSDEHAFEPLDQVT